MVQLWTRREMISATAGMTAVVLTAAPTTKVRLGGPIFLKSDDPRELAREHRRLGYSAAFCPNVKVSEPDRVREIEKAYAAEDVVIAEVGAWVNMMDSDTETSRKNVAYVTERLALADMVGARCCADIAGTYHAAPWWYGPNAENLSQRCFDQAVEICRKVIDAVKPRRTRFGAEMIGWAIPNGPDSYLRLIKAVDRPAFACHLDVCNAVNSPERMFNNSALIQEFFRKLGPWIVSCHAKDLAWIQSWTTHFEEVVVGRGWINYQTYLTELFRLKLDAPLMLEHVRTPEEYEEGKQHILKVGKEVGVTFA